MSHSFSVTGLVLNRQNQDRYRLWLWSRLHLK